MYKNTLALFLITVCSVCFFIAVPTATIWGQEAVEKPGFKSLADLQAVYRLLDQETFNANNRKTLQNYLTVNPTLLTKTSLKLAFLKAYPTIIPFLDIDENKDIIAAFLQKNPSQYLKLNLLQKQEMDFIETVFFHPSVSEELKTTVFKFSPEKIQYDLLIYNGSYLELVETEKQDNIDWVYRAAVQNSESIYFASKNMQRVIKLVGVIHLKRMGAFLANIQLKLSAFSRFVSDAIFEFNEAVSDWFRYRVKQPIYYFFGDDMYVEQLNRLIINHNNNFVKEPIVLADYVVKSPELISYLKTTTLGVVEDIRLVASKNAVDLLWVKSSTFDAEDFQIGFVLRSPKRYLIFPIYGKKSKGSYLFRPGDNNQWVPENIEVIQLEKKAMGFNAVLNWKSNLGDLRMRLTERRGVAVRDILGYTSKN